MHSPGRHMDPFSTAFNSGYPTSLDNSSDKEYEILCPKRHAMLVSSAVRQQFDMLWNTVCSWEFQIAHW